MKKINKYVILPVVAMTLAGCGGSAPAPVVTLSNISLSGTYQTEFYKNDVFNHEGLIVTASYSDGTTKAVDNYIVSNPDMTSIGEQDVIVTYKEGDISKTDSYTITILAHHADEQVIEAALLDLRTYFNELDVEDYTAARWNKMVEKFNEAVNDISEAESNEEVASLLETIVTYLANCPTAADVVKGTWFDRKSADSNYELDRDDDNNLTISYAGYPGHWVSVGTDHLETDVSKNNIFVLRFRNDSQNTIKCCFQLLDSSSGYKADSQIFSVEAFQEYTVRLAYDLNVNRTYFFVDSCEEHNRSGKVTILEARLDYEKREQKEIPEPKTFNVEKTMTLDDAGEQTHISLTESDLPLYVGRVRALLEIDFHANGNSSRWFGLHLRTANNSGTDKQHISPSDSAGYTREIEYKVDDVKNTKEYYIVDMEISQDKKLIVGDQIYMDVSYSAAGIDFKVISYTLYYTLWKEVVTEKVDVNTQIYIDGSGKDGDGNHYTARIPYSSFTKVGRVNKMEVEFETVNPESYCKSQVYIQGFPFAIFPGTGNNNVLNIAPIMEKSNPDPVTGKITLYLDSDIDISKEGEITFQCWWSSATDITVKSITMYTDNIAAPDPVQNLQAHPVDSGMVLTWGMSQFAQSYDVYNGDTLVGNVKNTFMEIKDLINGQEYTFKVVAKNASGSSDPVSVTGTPVEGATYDSFIEGLNTELEQFIGEEKMATLLTTSCQYMSSANNARLVDKIDALQKGEDTTVLFCGGSITVGENHTEYDEHGHQKGYAYWTKEWLKNNYDTQNKLSFVNASISGTGSEIGIVRAQKDIIDHNPDIVFIEFAANNGSTDFYRQSYESLIRKVMALPNDPAIVLVFSCTSYSGSSESYMKKIGDHYNLPMFTFDKGFRAITGTLDKERTDPIFHMFTEDSTHPNQQGHILMSKALCYFLRNVIEKEKDEKNAYPSSPSMTGYDKYDSLIAVDNKTVNGEITSLGSFVATNTATPSTSKQSDVTAFQQGWKKTDTTVNEPMVIDVEAKNFILIYEAGNTAIDGDPTGNIVVTYTNKEDSADTGTLSWDVSKTCKQNDNSHMEEVVVSGSGWQNPCGILIFDKSVAGNYEITIKMENASGICTIMAFGYSK